MAVVKISKDSEKNPFLPYGGQYGSGLEHEAECEVFQFDMNVEPGQGPGFDKDCKRTTYCLFVFRVKHEDQLVFVRHFEPTGPNTGSRAIKWLKALGAEMTETPDGDYVLDDSGVVGSKCGIVVKEPTQRDGVDYTGRLTDVIGL